MLPATNSTFCTPRSAARAAAWPITFGRAVQPGDLPGGDEPGEIAGDAARPAADVEHRNPGGEVRDHKRRGVLRRPGGMGADHRLVVAVAVHIVRLLRTHRETLPPRGFKAAEAGGKRGKQPGKTAGFRVWPSVLPLLAGAVLRMIRGVKTNSSKAGLGLFRATGIYVGAILGSGILVLPAIAAGEAGPASLLASGLLLVFCTPVAFSFAEMSRQQPDAAGSRTSTGPTAGGPRPWPATSSTSPSPSALRRRP